MRFHSICMRILLQQPPRRCRTLTEKWTDVQASTLMFEGSLGEMVVKRAGFVGRMQG